MTAPDFAAIMADIRDTWHDAMEFPSYIDVDVLLAAKVPEACQHIAQWEWDAPGEKDPCPDCPTVADLLRWGYNVATLEMEEVCEVMHDAYELAAQITGWATQEASRKLWTDVPEANKRTMRLAVAALVAHLRIIDAIHPCPTCGGSGEVTVGDGDYEGAGCHDEPCPGCPSPPTLPGPIAAEMIAVRLAESERREAAWINGVADAVERFGYDRDAACGPADLLPGLAELQAENERLRAPSWDELLGYFDLIYPADVFTGVSGDAGPRLIVAIRELAAERALADELAGALRLALHEVGPLRISPASAIALAHYAEARK